MKKLGKKLQFSAKTIESYYECYCSCRSSNCSCECNTGDIFDTTHFYPRRDVYNDVRSGPGPM